MKVAYIGPFDAVEVEGLGEVKNGESATPTADLAAGLLAQPTNWGPADDEAAALAVRLSRVDGDHDLLATLTVQQLKDLAAEDDIDLGAATRKDDLIAAIKAHNETRES